MKKGIKVICVLVFVTIFIWIPFAWSDQRPQALWGSVGSPIEKQFSTEFVPGEVLLKFKKGTTRTETRTLHSNFGAKEIRRIESLGVRRIKLPSAISVKEAVEYYKMDPNVKYAEPNYIINFTAMPNDSAFSELWGLHNTGQQVNGVTGTQDADIDAPEAWDIITGSDNIIIAVLDSGVAYLHPEINPNIWVNNVELSGTGGVDDDNNGYIDDIYGWDFWANDNNPEDYNSHGTHVSGTIAARGNNGVKITGVNWNAKIMAVKMGGIVGAVGDATDAIIYAVENGADIINASWGIPKFSQSLYDAINYANDHGVLFVAAAGNGGSDGIGDNNDQDPHYPSSYNLPNIIAVAATDQGDNLTGFSNYGMASVDVAAPGDNVYGTIPEFTSGTPVLLYTENFGPPSPSGWLFSGFNNTWSFGSGTGDPGDCLEDSPGTNYLNNTLSFAVFTSPIASVKDNYYTLLASVNAELEYEWDYLYLGFMEDSAFFALEGRTGSTGGAYINDSFDFTFAADIQNSFNFGAALVSDSSVTQDGVYIDNLELYREPIIISSYNYEYYPGTSMASPHVSGVAGLVKAQNPNYSLPQIRDAIFNTVDKSDSLSGKVLTEGRVNAFKAVTYIAPPFNFSALAGDSTVTLNWNANSESAVTGYIISYGETEALGTEIDVGDVITHEISGLTNGITYYFAVHAVGDFPVIGSLDGTDSDIISAIPDEQGGDSDGDGVSDNSDNCPNTYNPNQADSDEDSLGDACDGCPDDPDKTESGSCGCNNPDTDSDGDGTADCNDGCPNDSNKTDPGYCGCGIPETDSDGDGILDCEEQGPNGDDPNYDGNGDDTTDYQQANVTSLFTYDNQYYVTLESPAGTTINNGRGCSNPSEADAPSTKKFPYGFFGFTIEGMGVGGAIIVTLHLPAGATPTSYYKYGQTLNNPNANWYEFLHDGQTGAEINGNVITLHFIDGMRGDDDLTANGTITDVGGPAVTIPPNDNGILPGAGPAGGGCFIATAAYGSLMGPHIKVLRDFRDRFLITNIVGKATVKLYYKYSPPVADFITRHANLRAMVRMSLLPVVGMSWVAIKLGPLSTTALMVFFGISLIGLVSLRRKKVKK
jgi:subtilisin family serine protease